EAKGGSPMRRVRLFVVPAIIAVISVACGGGNDEGNGGGGENLGRVSVLGAGEPSEYQALQSVIDNDIKKNADYVATLESNADFETQVKIRVEGGNPPDVALYPQPGSVIEQAKAGNAIALEDMGFDIDQLTNTFGPYLVGLGEYNGKHYAVPT